MYHKSTLLSQKRSLPLAQNHYSETAPAGKRILHLVFLTLSRRAGTFNARSGRPLPTPALPGPKQSGGRLVHKNPARQNRRQTQIWQGHGCLRHSRVQHRRMWQTACKTGHAAHQRIQTRWQCRSSNCRSFSTPSSSCCSLKPPKPSMSPGLPVPFPYRGETGRTASPS